MDVSATNEVDECRMRLVEVGGRTAQDLGLGRIQGEVLVYLFLSEEPRGLDDLAAELRLSKAAVCVAARQLESLGLLRRIRVQGDRRIRYRSADNIASALQEGVLAQFRQKMRVFGTELEEVDRRLEHAEQNGDGEFFHSRVQRARVLHGRLRKLLESPLLRIFTRRTD